MLLRRDPWLMSQTLMQLLYLVPPAVMLWRSFSDSGLAIVLVTPVIVMAAGQLAGGLAWLTISGEDAADLVATAPLKPSRVIRAKIEVVLIAIAVIFAPLVAALLFASPLQAAVTALGIIIAAASATAIQLWFRVQAKRSQFRRRQTSSRLATFAEAFSSIGWAATAALALAGPGHRARQRPDDPGHRRRDLEDEPAAGVRLRYSLINSITAAANASGSSCGRLWPARGITRWMRRPENLAACAVPSVAGATPSPSPSSVMAGTVMTGSAASRRWMSAYCGSPSARPKR